MRILTFHLIAGYPNKMNKDEMTAKITGMVKEVNTNLGTLPGVYARNWSIVYLGDTPEQAQKDPCQARVMFSVRKEGRQTTWEDVMEAVNKVYAPHYEFMTI